MVPLGSNIHSYESGCNDGVLQICHSRIGRLHDIWPLSGKLKITFRSCDEHKRLLKSCHPESHLYIETISMLIRVGYYITVMKSIDA